MLHFLIFGQNAKFLALKSEVHPNNTHKFNSNLIVNKSVNNSYDVPIWKLLSTHTCDRYGNLLTEYRSHIILSNTLIAASILTPCRVNSIEMLRGKFSQSNAIFQPLVFGFWVAWNKQTQISAGRVVRAIVTPQCQIIPFYLIKPQHNMFDTGKQNIK